MPDQPLPTLAELSAWHAREGRWARGRQTNAERNNYSPDAVMAAARAAARAAWHEAAARQIEALADNPDLDATDGAHPAWWRGHDHTAQVFCRLVNAILDGADDGSGWGHEPWHATRQRLVALAEQGREAIRRELLLELADELDAYGNGDTQQAFDAASKNQGVMFMAGGARQRQWANDLRKRAMEGGPEDAIGVGTTTLDMWRKRALKAESALAAPPTEELRESAGEER